MARETFDNYEKAVGPCYAAQKALRLYAEDKNNTIRDRDYAKDLYIWLGESDTDIDGLMEIAYDYGLFILNALENIKPEQANTLYNDSNLLLNYISALESLRYQKNTLEQRT
jgi:hypothetical protein